MPIEVTATVERKTATTTNRQVSSYGAFSQQVVAVENAANDANNDGQKDGDRTTKI